MYIILEFLSWSLSLFSGDTFFVSFINGWTYRLWLVAKTDSIYYVLQGFIMYITFGK